MRKRTLSPNFSASFGRRRCCLEIVELYFEVGLNLRDFDGCLVLEVVIPRVDGIRYAHPRQMQLAARGLRPTRTVWTDQHRGKHTDPELGPIRIGRWSPVGGSPPLVSDFRQYLDYAAIRRNEKSI